MSPDDRFPTSSAPTASVHGTSARGSGFGSDSGHRPTVLIVDDVPANLLAFEGMLRRSDVDLVSATSGKEALEVLLARDVALALLDVQMPEMDGFELASLMRGVEKTRLVPIIFVTAGPHDSARVFRGYESGAVDYLFKPVDERILRSKVDVFVELDKQRRQLVEADRMREMFIAVLGHDLRNPLNGICVAADLLLQGAEQPKTRAMLERILISQDRMTRMINQLLDATRFRLDGSVSLSVEPTDLRELASRVLDELDEGEGRVQLAVEGDPCGTWDADRLQQILSNLAGNATKHSPAGEPVRVRLDGTRRDVVRLEVRNGGPPIPEDTRETLFEPFRMKRTTRHGHEGLGLGLFITRQLVRAHAGTISYVSDEESGTQFTVTLPREVEGARRRERAVSGKVQKQAHDPGPEASSPAVLIVEDDPAARDALGSLVEGLGYRVLLASGAPAALAAARTHPVDLLLTDVRLPGILGTELAEQLVASQPNLQVIYMTGDPEAVPGDAPVLEKPLRLSELRELLQQMLPSAGHEASPAQHG